CGTFLANRFAASTDLATLAPAKLFAAVPQVGVKDQARRDLRRTLAAEAFSNIDTAESRMASESRGRWGISPCPDRCRTRSGTGRRRGSTLRARTSLPRG